MSPAVGLGIGLIFAAVGMLTVYVSTHRENRDLASENRRLRIELGKRDQHPALKPRSVADDDWVDRLIDEHTAAAQRRLSSVAPVVRIPRQRGDV